jgi:hypothetical protein
MEAILMVTVCDDMPFSTWHIEDFGGDFGRLRAVHVIYDNRDCDALTAADALFPMAPHHETYAQAWVAMRSAAWPAKVNPSSSFGYPGDDHYSEYWRDDWGRRFLIEKNDTGLQVTWTMREVLL